MFGRGKKNRNNPKKIRVLLIAPRVFYLGGDEDDSLVARCQTLSDLNLDVDVLCYGDGTDLKLPGFSFRRGPKTKSEDLAEALTWSRKSVLDNKLFFKAALHMLLHRYHVIYGRDEGILVAMRLMKFFKTPEIVYDRRQDLIAALEKNGLPDLSTMRRRYENLQGRALNESTVVISSDPQSAEAAVAKIGPKVSHVLVEDSFRILPELADDPDYLEEFDTSVMLPLPDGRPIIGFMGNMGPDDGIDILIESFHQVRATRPDAFLLVIGGNKPQVKTFHTLAKRLSLEHDCLFTGRVPAKIAANYLQRMQMRILPATKAEKTLPAHFLSLAQGRPLLVTDIPEHRAIFHEQTACFAPPGADRLASLILEVLDSYDLASARAQSAQAFYQANFSREIQREKMKRAFEILARAATLKTWEQRQKKEDKKKRGKKEQSEDATEPFNKRAFQGRS